MKLIISLLSVLIWITGCNRPTRSAELTNSSDHFDTSRCDRCHPQLPHDDAFIESTHSVKAQTYQGQCLGMCHEQDLCNECHEGKLKIMWDDGKK